MKLKKVIIHRYKSFETEQEFEVEDDVTILVGKNESGKTSILEAIAKTNYFSNDKKFIFNTTTDYPRKHKKQMDKSGEDPEAVTCYYEINDETREQIENEFGNRSYVSSLVELTSHYDSLDEYYFEIDMEELLMYKAQELDVEYQTLASTLSGIKNLEEFDAKIENS